MILVTGGAIAWVLGIVFVNQFPHWEDVVQVLDHGVLAGCVAVDSSAMDCPVNGVNGVHSPGGVVLDHLGQEGCFSSHVANGAGYFVGDSASCHVELGQVAWKSGYLGQIIINVGSHVGSCQFVSQAVELGLELQVLVGNLVILMTFHMDHGWWIGTGAEGISDLLEDIPVCCQSMVGCNSGGLLAFLAMDND